MRIAATTFRLHRWLAWIVGLQMLLWIGGGLVFSLLPFKAWVKAGDAVRAPELVLPTDWASRASTALQSDAALDQASAITAVSTAQGPAWRVSHRGQARPWMAPMDGSARRPVDEPAVRRFALSLYKGGGSLTGLAHIGQAPRRLGLVNEVAGRRDLWRASFDDALGTRIYIDGDTGEFVAARNEAWVWYDFFWRLHIMDYEGGEDFNGNLLRAAAVAAGVLVMTGAVLAALAARRRWRARRR